MADDRTGRTVGDRLTVREHDNPVGDLGHQFNIMSRHDDAVAPRCELTELAGQPLLGTVVETRVGSSSSRSGGSGASTTAQRQREPLTFGEVLWVCAPGDATYKRLEHRSRRPRGKPAIPVAVSTFGATVFGA